MIPGIVHGRMKVNSAVTSARVFLNIQKDSGSFDAYIWGFVDGKPIDNGRRTISELPAKTELSETVS